MITLKCPSFISFSQVRKTFEHDSNRCFRRGLISFKFDFVWNFNLFVDLCVISHAALDYDFWSSISLFMTAEHNLSHHQDFHTQNKLHKVRVATFKHAQCERHVNTSTYISAIFCPLFFTSKCCTSSCYTRYIFFK